jgi:hypothetical protein
MWARRSILLGAAGLSVGLPASVLAQEALSSDDQFFSEGRYLPTYLDLKAKAEAGDQAARQMLSQFASFLGDEATAVGLDERPPRPSLIPPCPSTPRRASSSSSATVTRWRPKDGATYGSPRA